MTPFRSALLAALLVLLANATAKAAPEAHILRIDPRASQEKGDPILTTLVEIVQGKRVSEATQHCATLRGNSQFDCISSAMDKQYALYKPFPFPAQNAVFTVTVDGGDLPAKYVSHAKWGDSGSQPGVGTAWLVLIDADKRMGGAFDDAKDVAKAFINSMGRNDIVNVMFFSDRQVVKDSKWKPASWKKNGIAFVDSVGKVFQSQGRNRPLFGIIKQAATDGFSSLGDVGETVNIPLHQAMVVLSTGFAGADASSAPPIALQLSEYMSGGRFPKDNTALPKAPVPVISVWFPHTTFDEYKGNSRQFMENLANTKIGGYFTIMRSGQGGRAGTIVKNVRTRFSKMHIVKWRVSCIAPSIDQTFKLVFTNVKPQIAGDNTFKDVPVGIDPSTWPLDVNLQYTRDMVQRQGGVHPNGTFKVYGNFCWGGDTDRAEVYFLPAGSNPPAALGGADIEKAKRTQQQLIAMGMQGSALKATDAFVEFEAPDKDKIIHGSGDKGVARIIIFDNRAKRTSGITADSILEVKATEAPFPLLMVLGIAFGVVVLLLLVVIVFRSGGRRRAPAPQAPMVAGGLPPGGPYGAPPPAAPPAPYGGPPPGAPPGGVPPPGGGQAAPVSPEFMYGGAAPDGGAPHYGVTTDAPAQPGAPPPSPYADQSAAAMRATLQGAEGTFTVVPGAEVRAGRDGAQCGILVAEPRVSGVHASLKLESGQLLVRDENSNNGTLVNGNRLPPGVWTPAPSGSLLRFGPAEFSVRIE